MLKPAGPMSSRFLYSQLASTKNMAWRNTTERYGKVNIWLHWLTALFILVMIPTGIMAEHQADADLRLLLLRVHSAGGVTVLVLTFFRLIWRMSNPTPAFPKEMTGIQRFAARGAHLAILVVIVSMLVSGIVLFVISGAFNVVLNDFGQLPRDFHIYPPRMVHGAGAFILMILLVIHIAAGLYHHIVKKDDVLRNMLSSK
jgi:cytochrome b561